MKAIIVGGGKVGYFLMKTVIRDHNEVVLIEKDPLRAQAVSEELNVSVLCGDGSDMSVMDEAGIQESDLIAAVTGSDEENLVVCRIAKAKFPAITTIARINNPKNMTMFKALGVDRTVCSTKVIADLIENEMAADHIKIVQTFERGNMMLAEVLIDMKTPWVNKEVRQLSLPKDVILISVLRQPDVIYPKGETRIESGDHVMIAASPEALAQLKKVFNP